MAGGEQDQQAKADKNARVGAETGQKKGASEQQADARHRDTTPGAERQLDIALGQSQPNESGKEQE